MIGPTNEHRYVLATQDAALRKWAETIPGLPVISIIRSALALCKAPEVSREAAMEVRNLRVAGFCLALCAAFEVFFFLASFRA